jgi:hypothetical protein
LRRLLGIAALLLWATALRAGAQWHTVVEGDAQGGWAETTADQGTPLFLGDLVVSPALAWPGGSVLNPLLYVNSTAQQYSLENQQLFQRTWNFGARPTYTAPLNADWKWGARVEAQQTKNWETADEIAKMQGIYDDEEYGGGLLLQHDTKALSTHVSLDLSWRDYPYDRSPASSVLTGTAGAILDAWWWKLGLRHRDRLSDTQLLNISGWVAWRDYTDSYVQNVDPSVDKPGVYLPGRKQMDVPGSVDVDLDWRLTQSWALDLGVGCDFLWSNQNLFDQTGSYSSVTTSGSSLGVSMPGVYNSFDTRLDPGLLWQSQSWQAHFSGELLFRNTAKPIRDPDGVYTYGLQSDVEYGLGLGASRDLHWYHLSLVGNAAWRVVTSNQEFVQGQPYAYSYYNLSVGLQYAYASQ